jgi:hypothetical protein
MPDLDQIKTGGTGCVGTGAGGSPGAGRAIPRAARPAATTSTALLAGEGEALTYRGVELALPGDPAALRLCLGRIVGPHREPTVEFTMPAIRNAADLAGPKGVKADPTEAGKIRTLRRSCEPDAPS